MTFLSRLDESQLSDISFSRMKMLIEFAERRQLSSLDGQDSANEKKLREQLDKLEKALGGVQLRTRGSGKVSVVTSQGQELARVFSGCLLKLCQSLEVLDQRQTKVTISAGTYLLEWLVFDKIEEIDDRLQGYSIFFESADSYETIAQLRNGEIDLGLVQNHLIGGSVKGIPLGKHRYSLYVPEAVIERYYNTQSGELPEIPKDGNGSDKFLSAILPRIPIATVGGDGSFRRHLDELINTGQIPMEVNVTCQSYPQALAILNRGHHGVLLPTLKDISPSHEALISDQIRCQEFSLTEILNDEKEISLAYNIYSPKMKKLNGPFVNDLADFLKLHRVLGETSPEEEPGAA